MHNELGEINKLHLIHIRLSKQSQFIFIVFINLRQACNDLKTLKPRDKVVATITFQLSLIFLFYSYHLCANINHAGLGFS